VFSGNAKHFEFMMQANGTCCFSIDDLPSVVKVIWRQSICGLATAEDDTEMNLP
jgi:hypothetical protein